MGAHLYSNETDTISRKIQNISSKVFPRIPSGIPPKTVLPLSSIPRSILKVIDARPSARLKFIEDIYREFLKNRFENSYGNFFDDLLGVSSKISFVNYSKMLSIFLQRSCWKLLWKFHQSDKALFTLFNNFSKDSTKDYFWDFSGDRFRNSIKISLKEFLQRCF